MLRIDRPGPDQAARVRAVRLRALRDAPDAFCTTAEEEERSTDADWRDRLTRPDAVTVVASLDGADVGLAVGAPHHDEAGDVGLYAVWVAPEARGAGVGEALIRAVADWARARGHAYLRLEVGDANAPAVRLYDRLGFAPTGRTSAFPPPRAHITEHERALPLRPPAPPAGGRPHGAGSAALPPPRAG